MKLVLFFIFALVAIQGYQAQPLESQNRNVEDFVHTLQNILLQIETTISAVASKIPEFIEHVKQTIKQFVDKIPQVIHAIEDKVQQLVNTAGEIGNKCIKSHKEEIKELIHYTRTELQHCISVAEGTSDVLKQQLKTLLEKLNNFRHYLQSEITNCLFSHVANQNGYFNCFRDLVGPVKEKLIDLGKEVADTIAVAKEVAEEAAYGLASCATGVQQTVAAKETEILNSIKECIKETTNNA